MKKKNKIIATYGLPGSGKSTWAKEYVQKGKDFIRINNDDLRKMLFCGRKWTKEQERLVSSVREVLIDEALGAGYNIIVDNTHLNPKTFSDLEDYFEGRDCIFKVKDFTNVPLETCIERDLKRHDSVGKDVIVGMYNKYLVKKEFIPYNPELPRAIIVDVDGTLAHMHNRHPYEWDKVEDDKLDYAVASLCESARRDDIKVILLSGRDGVCLGSTQMWLYNHGVSYDHILMRAAGDSRKDTVIKKELFDEHIRGKYNVLYALDDRPCVIRMWQSMGIKVLNCGDGVEF